MKYLLLLICILFSAFGYSQDQEKINAAISFIRDNNIKLNTVMPADGFKVYYNCDSMLFMRGNFGDTIKIWTPVIEQVLELEELKDVLNSKSYGKTTFVKEPFGDGRLTVESYHQTQFIYRNDSLFEIANSTKYPQELFSKNFKAFMDSLIDQKTFQHIQDSIDTEFDKISVFVPKLIFTKSLFQGSVKKVKLSKKVNFMEDTIVLDDKWKENGKTCYMVRINNIDEYGTKTSYAYAINDTVSFIRWEGCYLHQK